MEKPRNPNSTHPVSRFTITGASDVSANTVGSGGSHIKNIFAITCACTPGKTERILRDGMPTIVNGTTRCGNDMHRLIRKDIRHRFMHGKRSPWHKYAK